MSILLLHFHMGRVNGTLTSLIDTYFNLKNLGIDCKLKIATTDPLGSVIQLFKRNNYFGDIEILKSLSLDKEFESETIICSYKLLTDNISISCNKLIILDSLDNFKYGQLYLPFTNIKVLANPANLRSGYLEYYHKFSNKRLSSITNKNTSIFYQRTNKEIKVRKHYFENIGKIIWENIYLENKVFYSSIGRTIEDGLHFYLKLFGVDSRQDYKPLPITKNEIIDKLFMRKDDLLLTLL